ncbi:ATP-binding protein [Carboxydothermus hydrogenoformans]|uniref:Conserved domain protein n=1 Tax=Carboxydothermus hydrogenoformans (strain ATCC BAA-161 / DSM 6008 / Z-2901) TaxID=246194 RepID=Q3AA99_CARHZ|nr:ATP-binding protein [Carboxydothermus hydrogenoformans]ABB16033.1 conserved domain protein [Carboxydothermus hydrogenoformans Z-2901]
MLFEPNKVIGIFKGFTEKGLEFAAELVLPYNASMIERPQLGQFILIELGSEIEAALGRITKFIPTGLLTTPEGEEYFNALGRRSEPIPEDLKEQKLRYRVYVKLLGAVKIDDNGKIVYVPSQRRLPHLGSKVAWPSDEVLREICSLNQGNTEIGHYVLGEFVYCGSKEEPDNPIFRSLDPKLPISFDIKNLIARRTLVFARAGYGKSNLMKLLLSELYRKTPTTEKGLKVGTLVFDADGEYFWPDQVKNRPGLCNVPHLVEKIVIFTNRPAPNEYYQKFIAGPVTLNVAEFRPQDVIHLCIPPEKQTNQNVVKLRSLSQSSWEQMVELIHKASLQAPDEKIAELLGYSPEQANVYQAEISAAKSNMFNIIKTLHHDPDSNLTEGVKKALSEGALVIVDISLLSSSASEKLAGLLLKKIFDHNQENFTSGQPIIPAIVVLEEAQSVLGKNLDDSSPFVEWVKEGRKYDLGAILITQQPGSIAPEILSQADNWFVFHLLSENDAQTLNRFNSHFSDDILAHLIGEPIQGNCYMWSAPRQPFVLPVRVKNFEKLYSASCQTPFDNTLVETVIKATQEKTRKKLIAIYNILLQNKTRYRYDQNTVSLRADIFYHQIVEAFKNRGINEIPSYDKILDYLRRIFGNSEVYRDKNSDNQDIFKINLNAWNKKIEKKQ